MSLQQNIRLLAVLIATLVGAQSLCAQKGDDLRLFTGKEGKAGSCDRGTLFQWSYGTSFSGGPDLNAPLVTDRPDFTEASSTVGRGVAQLEFGYTFTSDSGPAESVDAHSIGEPLLRLGMFADWFELRLAINYATETTTAGAARTSVNGSEDLYIGAKIGLTPQEGWLPEMALIPQMTVPTASTTNFGAGEVLPGVNWIYSWEINDFVSTAGQSQINRMLDDGTNDAYMEFSQSWTVAYTLTERFGAYTEWFALIPTGADTALPEHYFDGGFTYLLNNNIQLDVRGGVGLNDAADDYFVGVGMSVRYY